MPEYYIQKRLPRDSAEKDDLRKFHQLEAQRKFNNGNIRAAHIKHYARLKTRLIRSGLIAPATRDSIRNLAMEAYGKMPFYKKWWMKTKYYWKRFTSWIGPQAPKTKD